jgi:hypothetical protein
MHAFETTTTPAPATKLGDVVRLIRAEYKEMPGLCLTRAQVQRLWMLEPAACDHALRALVDTGYLRLTPSGYIRG